MDIVTGSTTMRAMPGMLIKNLRKTHANIARILAKAGRSGAPGKTKNAIHEVSNAEEGGIEIGPDPGYAVGTFFGASGRFGWYGADQFKGSTGRQFDPWVGNGWFPGDDSDVPYHIGQPINAAADSIEDQYINAEDNSAKIAFPIGDPT